MDYFQLQEIKQVYALIDNHTFSDNNRYAGERLRVRL